ncbi:MAG: hypothetical protein C4329_01485, partial [Chitinophagaceae bacterium]
SMRLEWSIDSSNQIIISPNLAFQNNRGTQNANTQSMYTNGLNANTTTNNTDNLTWGNNLNNFILYRHAFAKKGRTFSINLNSSYNYRNGDNYANSFQRLYDSTGINFRDTTTNRYTDQFNNGVQLSANFVYTEPIAKNTQLMINYNPTYLNSKADQEAYRFNNSEGKYTLFDTSLSNKFTNTFKVQNAGVPLRSGNRDNMWSIGLNYQHSTVQSDRAFPNPLQVNQSFDNILPIAMARLKLSTKSSLRVMYRASTNQPSVTQLQDVYDITNLPYITAGNPNLKQQYNHILSTRYTFTNTAKGVLFVANILGQVANNYITNATYVPLRDSIINNKLTITSGQQLTKPVNFDGNVSLRSFLTFSVPLKPIKSNLNFKGGSSYSRLPGMVNNVSSLIDNVTYSFGSVIGSNISQYVDFTISYTGH